MCGYLIYENKPTADVLSRHLHLQRNRGEDGFGAVHPETGRTVKSLDKAAFIKAFVVRMPRTGLIIVHHRKASLGGITIDLVHPIRSEVDTNVVVMQNGTKHDLVNAFDYDSDTVALAELWPQLSAKSRDKMTYGCGVVFVLKRAPKGEDNELVLSHDGKRSLYYCHEGDAVGMFASFPVTEGSWCKCHPLVGLPVMPLNLPAWQPYLPLKEPEAFVVNPVYEDDDEDYRISHAVTMYRCKDAYGKTYNKAAKYQTPIHMEPPTKTKVKPPPVIVYGDSYNRSPPHRSGSPRNNKALNAPPKDFPSLPRQYAAVRCGFGGGYDDDYGNAAALSDGPAYDSMPGEQNDMGETLHPCDTCALFNCESCNKFPSN